MQGGSQQKFRIENVANYLVLLRNNSSKQILWAVQGTLMNSEDEEDKISNYGPECFGIQVFISTTVHKNIFNCLRPPEY